jgi:uncharacterized protein (DUF433 family)
MGGKPCIRGLRMTVATIVGLVASGRSVNEILTAYPYLKEEDVREALAYAASQPFSAETEDDLLTSDLLESNAAFQALARSKASPRKPMIADSGE